MAIIQTAPEDEPDSFQEFETARFRAIPADDWADITRSLGVLLAKCRNRIVDT